SFARLAAIGVDRKRFRGHTSVRKNHPSATFRGLLRQSLRKIRSASLSNLNLYIQQTIPSSGGSITTGCRLIGREVGVLSQRVPTNSEWVHAKSRVQHKATRDCVGVVHAHNDAWISAPQKCCPIFKFNYFVGAPA